MEIRNLKDKAVILSFLGKDPDIQYYCLGDLDDFFWPLTTWYALASGNEIYSICMLYSGSEIPTLLLFCKGDPSASLELLKKIKARLPHKFYAHLSKPLISIFSKEEIHENYGLHYKMVMKELRADITDPHIQRLNLTDLDSIHNLYSVAYPSNWFSRRMLETGKYFGYFIDDHLAGISGIHVYSPEYHVAALGNIAVDPDHRGKGIAYRLTVRLCNDLSSDVALIGLNVRTDNDHAIRCYRKAGFEITGEYDECLIRLR
jgi:ribosomal protein S18 acetylase RimI-like enzyme